jgi:hypothetical protein
MDAWSESKSRSRVPGRCDAVTNKNEHAPGLAATWRWFQQRNRARTYVRWTHGDTAFCFTPSPGFTGFDGSAGLTAVLAVGARTCPPAAFQRCFQTKHQSWKERKGVSTIEEASRTETQAECGRPTTNFNSFTNRRTPSERAHVRGRWDVRTWCVCDRLDAPCMAFSMNECALT